MNEEEFEQQRAVEATNLLLASLQGDEDVSLYPVEIAGIPAYALSVSLGDDKYRPLAIVLTPSIFEQLNTPGAIRYLDLKAGLFLDDDNNLCADPVQPTD